MESIFPILTTLALLSVAPLLLRIRTRVNETTLGMAWRWAVAGWILWTGTWLLTACRIVGRPGLESAGFLDQLWYGSGVVMLCPLIAVLGAKQPMSRVWSAFILFPLVLVLGWPAASTWGQPFQRGAWNLEEPVLVGYAFILAMGAGNYFGTRFGISVGLLALALLLAVAPLCPATADWVPPQATSRTLTTLCLAAAGWSGAWLGRCRPIPGPPLDRVWHDFRNDFGVVWSRRVQERFNETARKENWPVMLTSSGFKSTAVSTQPVPNLTLHQAQIEATLRWLLRRFVEPAWIDVRLQTPPGRSVGRVS